MPKGQPPSKRSDSRLAKVLAKLGEIPQGYTINPEPKNKFMTKGMPKDLREKALKLDKEAQDLLKARMGEYNRVKKARGGKYAKGGVVKNKKGK